MGGRLARIGQALALAALVALAPGPAAAGQEAVDRPFVSPDCPAGTAVASRAELLDLAGRASAITGLPWDGSLPAVRYVPQEAIRRFYADAGLPGGDQVGAFYLGGNVFVGCGPVLDRPLHGHELCHHLQWINDPDGGRGWTRETAPDREPLCHYVGALLRDQLAARP